MIQLIFLILHCLQIHSKNYLTTNNKSKTKIKTDIIQNFVNHASIIEYVVTIEFYSFKLQQRTSIPVTMEVEITFSSEKLMSFFWFGLKVMMNNNFWMYKRKGNFQPRLKTIAFNGCSAKNRTFVFKNVLTLLNA